MHDVIARLPRTIEHAELLRLGDGGEPFRFVTAVVAAHSDDDVIGMGARLHRFSDITFVHITDGAPLNMRDARKAGFTKREEYARAREAEWEAALVRGGVQTARRFEARCIDQTASHHMPELIRFVADLVRNIGAQVVVTHPYEGGHPDHDATALAVHAAIDLERKRTASFPQLVEFASYHARAGRMTTFEFIPHPACPPQIACLSEDERRRKTAMMECFVSQRDVVRFFPIVIESFRRAPRYDFSRPPHEGRLYYEYFDWGMDGVRWTNYASEALREYALEGLL